MLTTMSRIFPSLRMARGNLRYTLYGTCFSTRYSEVHLQTASRRVLSENYSGSSSMVCASRPVSPRLLRFPRVKSLSARLMLESASHRIAVRVHIFPRAQVLGLPGVPESAAARERGRHAHAFHQKLHALVDQPPLEQRPVSAQGGQAGGTFARRVYPRPSQMCVGGPLDLTRVFVAPRVRCAFRPRTSRMS